MNIRVARTPPVRKAPTYTCCQVQTSGVRPDTARWNTCNFSA